IAFGTISFLIIYFSAGSLVGFFIDDVNVIETGAAFVRIYIAPMPVMALLFIFLHTMQAFGKAVQALILAICRDGLLFLPAIYLLNDALGVYGIIWAQPIADMLTILLAAAMYISIYRKAKAEAPAISIDLQ
ncbi:MAG: hypothetical protein PHV32_08240, partial [Eubacteriales bacterium]|nr:hypothetical protein [Eubacteriales bacterium]